MSRFLLLFFFLLKTVFSTAQPWQWTLPIGGAGNESVVAMELDGEDNIIATGTFTERLQIGGDLMTSNGLEDVWLAKISPEGDVIWSLGGGGIRQDEAVDVATDSEGNIYWLGFFRENIQIGSWSAMSGSAFKSIFILKISPGGDIIWAKTMTGIGSKGAGKMALDAAENLLITGFFTDSLQLDDQHFSATAGDFFLLKMNKAGDLDWFYQSGLEGTIEGKSAAVLSDGNIAVAGTFQGKVKFDSDTLMTNTPDSDVFLALFSEEGLPLWSRKAGGVYPAICTGLAADDADNLYLTGRHTGVIKLSDEIQIQTQGLNDNFFLLAYNGAGEPLWARSYGGSRAEQVDDIRFWQDQLILTGAYASDFQVDGREIRLERGQYGAFVGIFSTVGNLLNIRTVSSDEFVLGNALAVGSGGEVLAGLSFSRNIFFDANPLISNGFFDALIGKLDLGFTPVADLEVENFTPVVFPNPAKEGATIRFKNEFYNYNFQLFDARGQLLFYGKMVHDAQLPFLPKGLYFLKLDAENEPGRGKICKLIVH